ncbi:hypothetical protein KCP73_00965 [Salmonella enterica subsp. enterica]|nr:hypothetical protein KCP73_00965 [Salmonella enterica subsp. enterica]
MMDDPTLRAPLLMVPLLEKHPGERATANESFSLNGPGGWRRCVRIRWTLLDRSLAFAFFDPMARRLSSESTRRDDRIRLLALLTP